jgi:DNA-binding response OmpR family regulator
VSDAKDFVRINLKGGQVLLLQASSQGVDVLAQILTGFGAKQFHRCTMAAQAKAVVETNTIDLMLVEGQLAEGEEDGYDFVRWLRCSELMPNAFAPVLMTVGHTSARNVAKARDCGAHFVVAKPVVPGVLWDRLLWIARENRAFVKAGSTYSGPDRRFKNEGPPPGTVGRRSNDLPVEVGKATDPNLSQGDIDSLLSPRKVSL